jgi:cobalt/nickel transport protein
VKKFMVLALPAASFIIILTAVFVIDASEAEWAGVDETVVEKFARDAGREARDPFINTDQGDLLLFVFLLAGSIGGFVMGYYFRQLFPPEGRELK